MGLFECSLCAYIWVAGLRCLLGCAYTSLRLEDQAERTKKILSANSETSFAVECLLEDRDISGLITRELFEELCAASFKPALVKLLQQAVAISGTPTRNHTPLTSRNQEQHKGALHLRAPEGPSATNGAPHLRVPRGPSLVGARKP